jgi:hypothetical protein
LAHVKTDVSEENITPIFKVIKLRKPVFIRSMLQFLVAANIVPNSMILFTLMEICSTEVLVLKVTTRHHIPGDGILHNN